MDYSQMLPYIGMQLEFGFQITRNGKPERTSLPRLAFDANLAIVAGYNLFADCQPQS